jgi:hypothetical protein
MAKPFRRVGIAVRRRADTNLIYANGNPGINELSIVESVTLQNLRRRNREDSRRFFC